MAAAVLLVMACKDEPVVMGRNEPAVPQAAPDVPHTVDNSDLIATARALIADYDTKTHKGGRLADAVEALGRIAPGSPQFPAGQKLLSTVRGYLAAQQKQEAADAVVAAQKARADLAATIDQAYLNSHVDVDSVKAVGTTLKIRYALCSRVFLNEMNQDTEARTRLVAAGFKLVECSDGVDVYTLSFGD